jgi:hypothetical protein
MTVNRGRRIRRQEPCAFSSAGGVRINDNLEVPTDAETLVSIEPDPWTLC